MVLKKLKNESYEFPKILNLVHYFDGSKTSVKKQCVNDHLSCLNVHPFPTGHTVQLVSHVMTTDEVNTTSSRFRKILRDEIKEQEQQPTTTDIPCQAKITNTCAMTFGEHL